MKNYGSVKGIGVYSILGVTVLYDIIFILIYYFVDSYELSNLLKLTLIVFNIYEAYYILICKTLNYSIDESAIYINSIFGLKKERIPFSLINAYQKSRGHIKGVKLLGHGKNNFAIGKSFIDKIGTTYMFVTSTKNIIYLNTDNVNYGISPDNFEDFEKQIALNGVKESVWKGNTIKTTGFNRNKKFLLLFSIAAILVIVLTLNPIAMYFLNKIPARMPLTFNTNFTPEKFGTGRQFAFKQMSYGLLNMAILFCMYYAGFLYEKYDKKSSYRFIFISMVIAGVFLIMQLRIIATFR
ncbi:PH domain-containing protein [Clostridium sp. LBM24168]